MSQSIGMENTMRIIMLGTGDANVGDCYNTCFILEQEGFRLLVDAGGGNQIIGKLRRHGLRFQDIHALFLTHEHTDHMLGAIWVLWMVGQLMTEGVYEGDLDIYGNDAVVSKLRTICEMIIRWQDRSEYDRRIRFNVVSDGQTIRIGDHPVTVFDIGSTKARQFGFTTLNEEGRCLTCLGDEPYHECEAPYVDGCNLLMHEAYCLYSQADELKPYEISHSTVKDACELAQRKSIPSLLLYHTEEDLLATRRERFIAEGRLYYSGNLMVPDDDDVIEF